MKKRLVLVLATFILAISLMLVFGFFISPKHLSVKTSIIETNQIDPSLEGISIVYFSDVYFNEFMDQERFDKVITKINKLAPDVVLFGGNLVADDFTTDEAKQDLINSLKKLEAPYGKFAVLGQLENETNSYISNIDSFYQEANFEILNNQVRQLYFGNEHSIQLVGLTSKDNQPKINDMWTIAFSHSPQSFNNTSYNLMIAGQTLGGQINVPLLKDNFTHNNDPYRGTTINNESRLDISNGIGTTQIDMRLFAPAQINQYILKFSP